MGWDFDPVFGGVKKMPQHHGNNHSPAQKDPSMMANMCCTTMIHFISEKGLQFIPQLHLSFSLKKQRHACHFSHSHLAFADAKCLCRSSRTYASSEETVTVALALVPLSIVYLGNSLLFSSCHSSKNGLLHRS